MSLDYPVVLKKSEEGFAVGCPALPGCWSQGRTEEEALENIRIAIQEYLEVLREGKHTVLSDGTRILTVPRHNPINAYTMGGIAKDAGLTPDQFRDLL
jgi:predicted RNase H-like HicB family nuclease